MQIQRNNFDNFFAVKNYQNQASNDIVNKENLFYIKPLKKTTLADVDISNYKALDEKIKVKHPKNGVTEYSYNGAHYKIYKRENSYKKEYYFPSNFNRREFFDKLDELEPQILTKKTSSDNSAININGEIDEVVIQGNTGDCWLISALESLNSTESGRAAIKNAIKVNSDDSITVTFKGVGISYTISKSELKRYDTDNNLYDSYSNGDNDVLAFELATEKLWKDISRGAVKINSNNESDYYVETRKGIDNGGFPVQFIYYLTGENSKEYYTEDDSNLSKNTIYQVLEEAKNNKNIALNFAIYDNVHTGTLTNGAEYSLDVGDGGHALAITEVTDNTVTFVNPWDTSKAYTMTWEEFASFGIGYMSSTKIPEQIEENEFQEKISEDNEIIDNEIEDNDIFENDDQFDIFINYEEKENNYDKFIVYLFEMLENILKSLMKSLFFMN